MEYVAFNTLLAIGGLTFGMSIAVMLYGMFLLIRKVL